MKELSIEEKAKRYDEILAKAKRYYDEYKTRDNILYVEDMEDMFPELKESEDDRIRKWIIGILSTYEHDRDFRNAAIDWLEKQGKYDFNFPKNYQDSSHPNGGIVLEDFNGGEGFYKLHLDYLNKKQVEEVEEMVRVWNKELKTPNENIKSCIGMCLTDIDEQRFADFNTNLKECLDWLEKQGKPIDKIVKRAMNEKQRVLLTETDGSANIDWDCRSLDDVKILLKCGLEFIRTIEANKQMPTESRFSGCSFRVPTRYDKGVKQGGQKPAEWSEEDERNLNDAILFIKTGTYSLNKDNLINWLKSLRPQSQWKPSDEQMKALKEAVDEHFDIDGGALWHLYEDLKKLKE